MARLRMVTALGQMQLLLASMLVLSVLVEALYEDLGFDDILVFIFPIVMIVVGQGALVLIVPGGEDLSRGRKYQAALVSFLLMVLVGSLPFVLSGTCGPLEAMFESMAGFTTTGLSTKAPSAFEEAGRGLLFYRTAIQWVGGFYYLTFAFLVLSDIADIARRGLERRVFSWIGLVPSMTNLMRNLLFAYTALTLLAMAIYRLGGVDLFDSACLSLSALSTGGYSSIGREVPGGGGIKMFTVVMMFLAGTGFYIHLSLLASRGRGRALMDVENVSYLLISITAPVLAFLMLMADGTGMGESLTKGAFAAISAITTTGFQVPGMDNWPDSMKLFLVLLMLVGGSSLSLASGLKVYRTVLLFKGFINLIKGSSHPQAALPLKRGEGSFSDKALEMANMSFIYLLTLLFAMMAVTFIYRGGFMDVLSLCSAAVSNSGIAYGAFHSHEGIAALPWVVKSVLIIGMVLGRFELLLPLYLLTPKSRKFNG